MAWFLYPVAEGFPLLNSFQIVSGAHPASYPVNTAEFSPREVKQRGRDADRLPPSNVKVKNDGNIPPLLHKSSSCGG
jgi:hypothetical protein